jgi:hypothetical protein
MNMTRWSPRIALALIALAAGPALADPVGLTRDMMSVTVDTAGGPVEIMREQDNAARLDGDWTLTSRPCPNFCIQPMIPAEGVTPVGELEVLAALQDPDTLVIDGRIPSEFEAGTIPGAISMPYNGGRRPAGRTGLRDRFRRLDLRRRPACRSCCSATAPGAVSRPRQRAT